MDAQQEGKARERMAQANRARAILEDPLYVESFASVEAQLIATWKRAKDPAERDRAWVATKLLDNLRAQLALVMQGGKVAESDLIRLEQKRRLFG